MRERRYEACLSLTSPSESLCVQTHRVIDPFLSASSGKPCPTCHRCATLVRTEMPASRAEYTSSIHVFNIVMTEMVIDLGSTSLKLVPPSDAPRRLTSCLLSW